MSKQIKTHKCPTCSAVNECDIVVFQLGEPQHHVCITCGSRWREDGVVMASGGEPK